MTLRKTVSSLDKEKIVKKCKISGEMMKNPGLLNDPLES